MKDPVVTTGDVRAVWRLSPEGVTKLFPAPAADQTANPPPPLPARSIVHTDLPDEVLAGLPTSVDTIG